MKNIVIIGGGTFNHVRNHLSLSAPAFGSTARKISEIVENQLGEQNLQNDYKVKLILTKMADNKSNIVTNSDVEELVTKLIEDPQTKAIFFNVALADFNGIIDGVESGKYAERLKTSHGDTQMTLTPSDKLIGMIRKERKDIFVIGFKTTTGFNPDEQYIRGLELLKNNSLNIVLANDTVERRNMIIVPEESRYCVTTDRDEALQFLVKMTLSRMKNKFTRSTVIDGKPVDWNSNVVPAALRTVVNHCIKEGAYKPFLGKTAGHFAVKIDDNEILTSIRKTNFNNLDKVGLVKIESKNEDEVIAHGFKPSVGGQSQRIIFKENPELDCIVHFHSPVKPEFKESIVPVKPQWPNECGSHQCGQNTSNGLKTIDLGDGDSLKVVYLDEHGPNIVFNQSTPADKVINFIDKHFDLKQKTGGLVENKII